MYFGAVLKVPAGLFRLLIVDRYAGRQQQRVGIVRIQRKRFLQILATLVVALRMVDPRLARKVAGDVLGTFEEGRGVFRIQLDHLVDDFVGLLRIIHPITQHHRQ